METSSTSDYLRIEASAVKLLAAFGATRERAVLGEIARESLQPRDEDYAQIFVPEAAEIAQKGYKELWAQSPVPQPQPGQTEILIALGRAEELSSESGIAEVFPGGYQSIAHYLLPDKVWLTWKYVKPGETSGMTYDGLVWLEDRFAWFPKPWKVLSPLL
ncbi:hypothetical protein [Laspinema olomoucense]|uniref:Uncharacterized protein n=1 Tax=Laspinema olomoucense D3b TaxID=2953688 RepID=A0ABT2N4W9_9CYAN|nr:MULTISPECIES: hypothetical protein [unclassified Laspinema]MCT7973039.1 hypothetical protein [Laspinema sp. D3d]MCT7977741.1 hypothetical protein [Laspinema sp. D3b]